jgi:hypothetical protein
LIGLPNVVAGTPGRPLLICVENWTASILRLGWGVTFPSNNASITNGTAGSTVNVAVAEAIGVAVISNGVTACVAVFCGAGVSVGSAIVGTGDLASRSGMDGSSNSAGLAKMASAMPARIETPKNENARLAREVFSSRL